MMARWRQMEERVLELAQYVAWLPPLAARLCVGLVFLQTGWGKLHNLERVIAFFERMNIPAPQLQAPMVAGFELVCGALLVIGLLTRLASLPLIAIMGVAIATAKAAEIQELTDLFMLPEFLFILVFLWLAISGPGAVSADHLWRRRFPGQ